MWKDYSLEFVIRNRASSISISIAAFISTLFLSLLCSLFFNFWSYEVERIVLEEGNWQGRITGIFDETIVSDIENFSNVKKAGINDALSDNQEIVIDITFQNMRTIYQDMPVIARTLDVPDSALSYHEFLLSRYLIHDPQDKEPPLLMYFYVAVLLVVSISLILIIHNSFAVSMNARIHQFGIFSSIGATPGQIRTCLLQEAAALCVIPVLFGSFIGIALSYGTVQMTNTIAAGISGRHKAVFTYHPLIFAVTILSAALTIWISAWLPARKLSKLTPLAAIKNTGELQLKKKKFSPVLSLLFGIEGELAGNALKAQRKALRTSTLSFTLSFLAFTLMLCFFTLSGISTNYTYFERYQNAWDIMATVKDTSIENFASGKKISELNNVASSVVYQRAEAVSIIPHENMSDEIMELGGLEAVAEDFSTGLTESLYSIPAPIIIMDDDSFRAYCKELGIKPDVTGGIVLNRIWDRVNSNFRYKEFIPYLCENQDTITLQSTIQPENTVTVPILGYTQEAPALREEYENNTLVQFLPVSAWNDIADTIGNTETNTYIRILAENRTSLSSLTTLEKEISEILAKACSFEIENRIQERIDNDYMLNGYMLVIGASCALLAIIGLANVFSNTLGFIRQRKREFARYLSIGMTPASMQKMFCIEAIVIAGRPLLVTLPLTVLIVGFMIRASYLNPVEFLAEAPVIPIAIFIFTIFVFVALAYYIGGKKIMHYSLTEALRNENE